MRLRALHGWDLSPDEARALQAELRGRVELRDGIRPDEVRLVAGVDNGYLRSDEGTTGFAAVVVLTFPALEVVEQRIASRPATFPYVPGLLSFREAPAVLAALEAVESEPDLFVFDAQGYAHPRRLGAASHLGLFVDRPSIGCAKSRLIGRYEEPPREPGARTELVDRGETVGAVVRTRPSAPPLFVSPGHLITVDTAVELVLACCREGRRLPEPTRLAHDLVSTHTRALRPGR
ncbi:MAG TPA: deoxyribonuclease V [Chloroflexota bacterium]|nr:deoxyribonuclease V [Chloroflexota bacterium]